ncbi:superoxide dismutase [Fe] [Alphaproteobacteria bacterium]|nr:superoxide dismutase [Fe] [Alphaproteobacteria bacterium]GHS98128.1 superoxide dismutase [Fe] [Alphaproteobacteria bacterium]
MDHFQAHIDYPNTELLPILSAETIDFHYGKHHCGYAQKLNALSENTTFTDKTLEDIILQSRGTDPNVFNNAAQLFNHDFYWKCLKREQVQPVGKLKHAIGAQFKDFDEFLSQYKAFANTLFGSGWSWIVWEKDRISFVNTQNAETILGTDQKALCVLDLWEHAYYIDYRHDRPAYIQKMIHACINWTFCESQWPS